MDTGEITVDRSESFVDRSRNGNGVKGGNSSQGDSRTRGPPERNHLNQSDDTSGLAPQQDAVQPVLHAGATDGIGGIVISSVEQLSNAINLGNLSQVKQINLDGHDIGSGYLTLAEALASGQMSSLELLWLRDTGLTGNRSEAVCNALTSGIVPSLTSVDLASNKMGTKGVEALGRAIRSGNLGTLAHLVLYDVAINDDDMAILATAFAHGEAGSVLPNLWRLDLERNSFTEAGLKSLAEVLTSGRLDSLHSLDMRGCLNLSEEGANAFLSAFTLNSCLSVAVEFEWHRFPDLHRRIQQLRQRNIRNKENLENLSEFGMTQATFGKVYLCGSPEVGKTTLRRTLQRTLWQSLWTWERKPLVEQRTKGIDVSHFSSNGNKMQKENPITLFVWDMAGQEDYHLVHNAFFPDLSSAEGKATVFIIVCSSKDLDEAKKQVEYWLRYIASSCHKTTTRLRHVFVVMNQIGGDKKVQGNEQDWKEFLDSVREDFIAYLDVHTNPFVVDLRRRRKVEGLKKCLLEHSREKLEKEKVPEICKIIQMSLTGWSEAKKDFPVLHWQEFVQQVQSIDLFSKPASDRIIDAAARYLNEAGVLIYIDKSFPSHWGIPYQRLIVLIPNWFCNEVIGNIFLTESMVGYRERHRLFRKKVVETTGSVSISDFKDFFKSKWSDEEFEDMIAILLWLGLCYMGKNENLFIPSLIEKSEEKCGRPGPWQPQSASMDNEDLWVMGFSILHKESAMTLAPMTLWHRFQVEVAQTPKFNGELLDNDFVADKYLMTFTVDYMNVLIEVDAREEFPTFNGITFLVKAKFAEEDISGDERKQQQVNLANDLVNILLRLWDDICGGVQYVHKVVWPWPASQTSRPQYNPDRNVEVAEVKRLVQTYGMGRKMQWTVGSGSAITEDQLLSTKDKYNVIKSAQSDVSALMKRVEEAVKLRIYPSQLIEESSDALTERLPVGESAAVSDKIEEGTVGPDARILLKIIGGKLDKVAGKLDEVAEKLNEVENMLREGFAKVLKEQKRVFRKVQDTERFFKEDKDRTCPNLIYLGQKDPGVWASLKQALSPSVNVRLRFACEAGYNNYRPHEVQDQQGLDVSTLRPTLKKIAPWLKVSLTILLISAKIATNVVAPGAGLIVPNFQQLQQASSLLDGIVWATGFPMEELDKLMIDEMGLDANEVLNPRVVYGKSRAAITDLIRKLTPETYEQKFALRRVCLSYSDGSLHGVVWICTGCLKNFRNAGLVSEMS